MEQAGESTVKHDSKQDISSGRLVVISNRLPFTLKRQDDGTWSATRGAGGLVAAMTPLLERMSGIWVGWPGESSAPDTPGRADVLAEQAQLGFHTVELSNELVAGFYEGFSNETIWPLFHHFPFLLKFNSQHWADYREANERFRDAVLKLIRPTDLIWVHDYQLMLLPQLLREAMPEAKIGFFLHIPFPPSAIFRVLPRGEELLAGLLGANLIAFHTHTDLQHFRNSIQRGLGLTSQMDHVEQRERVVRLEALPISINPKDFIDRLHHDARTADRLSALRSRYAGRKVLVAVDRLDYTKGIPERLRTFRWILKNYPALRGQVVLIQVAVPSREHVDTYKDLGQETDELAGQVNGEFGTPDWTPLVYIKRGLPPEDLTALYAHADVGWVTPLRDGMNLVAKEYVACKEGMDGVLVLSEFAGVAAELGEALQVNPYDLERTGETVARALEMPQDERRDRMEVMYRRLLRNDVFAWGDRFVERLNQAVATESEQAGGRPRELDRRALIKEYVLATKRLILLDYDGTLVPFAKRPQDAVPPDNLLRLIKQLTLDPANSVVVVSGRTKADLTRWFGPIEGLWLAAEHGAVVRAPRKEWVASRSIDPESWKPRVLTILNGFVDRTPGSFIEEKEFSLVWHHRMADPEFGSWAANELLSTLAPALSETELVAQQGNGIVEVKLMAANKGEVLVRLAGLDSTFDFTLFIGDDRTDEDLFARLAEPAWTVLVGDRTSRARSRVASPEDVFNLLNSLVSATGGRSNVTA